MMTTIEQEAEAIRAAYPEMPEECATEIAEGRVRGIRIEIDYWDGLMSICITDSGGRIVRCAPEGAVRWLELDKQCRDHIIPDEKLQPRPNDSPEDWERRLTAAQEAVAEVQRNMASMEHRYELLIRNLVRINTRLRSDLAGRKSFFGKLFSLRTNKHNNQ